MATFSVIPREQAERLVMGRRSAERAAYRDYMRALQPGQAGRLELEEGDRAITVRTRLNAAAKAEGVPLEIQRRGNIITFWKQ
jgi:hypothetical protein